VRDPQARWSPLEGSGDAQARQSPLEGGGDPRAMRTSLEGGVSPRARRILLEGMPCWAALMGHGGHRGVGCAVRVSC
jgi:hypothetical protein